jgi:hypothetical protein
LAYVGVVSGQELFTTSYEGHQVLRFMPANAQQVQDFNLLQEVPHQYEDYDFWRRPSNVGRPIDIRVSAAAKPKVEAFASQLNLTATVHIADLQRYFIDARVQKPGDPWDAAYHKLADINTFMDNMASTYPTLCSKVQVATTYAKKAVYALKVGSGARELYFDGGIHAREWMAPATIQYIIGQLVTHNASYTSYLSDFTWYLVPVWNQDGYEYTWTSDPNWRKNRQPNKGACVGTDPCRNADAGWGGAGSSNDPCSDIYHGTAAWSAPMMSSFRDFISNMTKLQGYINFHSNAEMWLNAYGYTAKKPADYAAQEQNAKNATAAIKAVSGSNYGYGPAYTTIYPAAGVPSDWVYDKFHVKFSQAVELRGDSFQPSPTMIIPIGKEIMQGVLKLADDILANIPA